MSNPEITSASALNVPRETLPAVLFDGSFTRAGGDALKFSRHLQGDIQCKESVGIKMTDAQKIMQFRSRLRGDAFNWFFSLGDVTGWSYDMILDKFRLAFHPINYDHEIVEKLRKYKQGNKTTAKFIAGFRNIYYELSTASIYEEEVVKIILQNFHPEIYYCLSRDTYRTMDTICSDAMKMDAICWRAGKLSSIRNAQRGKDSDGDTIMDVNSFRARRNPRQNRRGPLRCFRCKKPGHFKKDCPQNNSSGGGQSSPSPKTEC
ncbi:unnamed protein product [[Candida] boidinii]|uniref:Unnamed protein product n=1 Tax=Candida boidinii TaxID=5477 RepID=A0ACB5U294_CANBO|nr:unnamed protein product [[Candida] boidinii]